MRTGQLEVVPLNRPHSVACFSVCLRPDIWLSCPALPSFFWGLIFSRGSSSELLLSHPTLNCLLQDHEGAPDSSCSLPAGCASTCLNATVGVGISYLEMYFLDHCAIQCWAVCIAPVTWCCWLCIPITAVDAAVSVVMRPFAKMNFPSFKATNKKGQETFYTASKFVIATGERPRYLGIQGDKEYCITR